MSHEQRLRELVAEITKASAKVAGAQANKVPPLGPCAYDAPVKDNPNTTNAVKGPYQPFDHFPLGTSAPLTQSTARLVRETVVTTKQVPSKVVLELTMEDASKLRRILGKTETYPVVVRLYQQLSDALSLAF